MKHILIATLLAIAPAVAFTQDVSTTIQQEAKKCAKALLSSDFDAVIVYTHERVIGFMGGKEAMIAVLKRGTDEMRSQGIRFEDVTIGEAEKPRKVGSWLVTLVPQRILMKVPGGRLVQESHLLGISEDDGKKWVFVDISNSANVAKAFPEIAGKITLPERKQPVIRKD